MGGTAIGTALNANPEYVNALAPTIAEISGIPVIKAEDLVDGTQNLDSFAFVSSALKTCAISCSKIANDFRLMSSGPRCGFEEINLPAMQNGSSIMPGKVNPVIPEVMSQAAFCIMGNDVSITMAAEAGQLELNYAEPILYHKLFESIVVLTGAVQTFTENCVSGITANEEKCREHVENSVGVITAICPTVGYKLSADIAKTAIKTGQPVREILKSKNIFTDEEIDEILDMIEENPLLDGITFSGGEPTVQAKALIPLCKRLKEEGIHICIDTNGSIWNEWVEELFSIVDLVLLDVKEHNPAQHLLLTERSNEQTLRTAEWLERNGKPFWLRYVLVPGYSDREEDIRALGEHFGNYTMLERVEILPYHTLGVHKYEAMGQEYKLKGVKENTPEQLDIARRLFEQYFKTVFVN